MGKKKRNKSKSLDDVVILPYNLEAQVNRLWLEESASGAAESNDDEQQQPLGVQALLELLVAAHPNDPAPSKRQVRMAKNAIPYRHIIIGNSGGTPQPDAELVSFIQRNLEQRSNFRGVKRWDQVDQITDRLQALGVEVDDKYKTWKLGIPPVVHNDDEETTPAVVEETKQDGVPCQMCGRYFGSKNMVFKHLRDPTSTCGNALLGEGKALAEPPSVIKKQITKQQKAPDGGPKRQKLTPRTGSTTKHAPPGASVWLGDLPLPWTKPSAGQYKHLQALLFRYSPPGTLQPRIKTVARKAYRGEAKNRTCSEPSQESVPPAALQEGQQRDSHLGYAILVYRDAAEATLAMDHMKDLKVETKLVYPMGDLLQSSHRNEKTMQQRLPDFALKIRPASSSLDPDASKNLTTAPPPKTIPGLDPPILLQLSPLPMEELRKRFLSLSRRRQDDAADDSSLQRRWESAASDRERRDLAAQAYTLPRECVHLQGRLITDNLRAKLLNILQNLRWPANNQRTGLSAERYLVLTMSSQSTVFEELKQACRELMDWADAGYHYSGIAVTKNFVASPHIDDRDQSYQYAVSLGEFTTGGELCVEGNKKPSSSSGAETTFVNVVETKNRIARVDGRKVHWVRTWQGGDRYSLIFYDTSDRNPTPVNESGVCELDDMTNIHKVSNEERDNEAGT